MKKKWNDFISNDKHFLVSKVSASLPKNGQIDKKGKKLPTPNGLFLEYISPKLKGNWSSLKIPDGFVICVEDVTDKNIITNEFGQNTTVKSTFSNHTIVLKYIDKSYGNLARKLGYSV